MDPIFDLIQSVPFQRLMYIIIDKAHQIYQIHRVHGQKLMRVNAPQGDSSILRPLKKLISDFQNSMAWIYFLKRIYDPKLFKKQSILTLQRSLSTFHSLTISSVYKWLFAPCFGVLIFGKNLPKQASLQPLKCFKDHQVWKPMEDRPELLLYAVSDDIEESFENGRSVSEGKFKGLNSEWMLGVGSRSKREATGLGFTSLYKQTDGVSNIKLNYSALYNLNKILLIWLI
ncbi:unnamed protein product [Paramecium pentaurelia]|uniref:Uncharacterized protein n=1 Tax=Paramecium pentaurelia TaxID=43138 RepID=A0A8S1V5V5_9CILI|nr:unnamed protein product [Paramecium pentaurelia]